MKLYSTADVAEKLGVSEQRVRQAALDGIGKKLGVRAWVFTEKDVEAIRARMGKRGRPAKEKA